MAYSKVANESNRLVKIFSWWNRIPKNAKGFKNMIS